MYRILQANARTAALLAGFAAVLPAWAEDDATPKAKSDIEGAIGLLVHHNPAFPGSSDYQTRAQPAGFLRWGRFTVTGAGGFTTKRDDEVERGLGAQLVRREGLRVSLGLRYDNGRSESDSVQLAGMGEIKRTVRARLSTRWDIDPDWRASAGLSVDALNRGGGYVVDASLAREWRLPRQTTWTMGVGVSGAGDKYMQNWHGVTAEQAARSGYPEFRAREGLRDVRLTGVLRSEFAHRWAGFVGFGVVRALGSAADSPLTRQLTSWQANGAVVWRF